MGLTSRIQNLNGVFFFLTPPWNSSARGSAAERCLKRGKLSFSSWIHVFFLPILSKGCSASSIFLGWQCQKKSPPPKKRLCRMHMHQKVEHTQIKRRSSDDDGSTTDQEEQRPPKFKPTEETHNRQTTCNKK